MRTSMATSSADCCCGCPISTSSMCAIWVSRVLMIKPLNWAAENNRIIVTHDRATMPDFAFERIDAGREVPGVFVLNDLMPVGQAIGEILLVIECSEQSEWSNRVVHLPL